MAGNELDPKLTYIAFDGYVIDKSEFADATVEITCGGDNSEVVKGKAGGHQTIYKYDKIDQLTVTLFIHSASAQKLENYHNTKKQITSLVVKSLNPNFQKTWTSTAVNVKSYDAVNLQEGGGYAFTFECEEDFEIA